jgi:hypothetical protein
MGVRHILVKSPLRSFALFAVKYFRWNKPNRQEKLIDYYPFLNESHVGFNNIRAKAQDAKKK